MSAPPAVVTISAAYGTGGEAVGRAVAGGLGLPFLDRAIPAAVAKELMAPLTDVEYAERHLSRGLGHWLDRLVPLGSEWLGSPTVPTHSAELSPALWVAPNGREPPGRS